MPEREQPLVAGKLRYSLGGVEPTVDVTARGAHESRVLPGEHRGRARRRAQCLPQVTVQPPALHRRSPPEGRGFEKAEQRDVWTRAEDALLGGLEPADELRQDVHPARDV